MTYPDRILAFDPGGTTGWALQQVVDDYHRPINPRISLGHIDGNGYHKILLEFLHETVPSTIVYERFDYRMKKRKVELEAVEYIGVIKLYSQMTNCPIIEQPQMKDTNSFWDNDKLKALGIYTVGVTHSNDAARQLLHYITHTLKDISWVRELQNDASQN